MTIENYKINHLQKKTISRSLVIKIIAILGIFVGIGILIQQTNASKNELKQAQALQVFIRLDDMVHQRFNEISAKKDPRTAQTDKEFVELDRVYHDAKNLNEKYRAAKNFREFLWS